MDLRTASTLRTLRLALVPAFALAGAACTAPLALQRLAPGEAPPPGLVFPLAFTRFELTVTRSLAGCDAEGATVETRVEAGAGQAAPDPAHTYLVRPGPGAPWATTQARVAYAKSGAAKGFNATVDDRSAATAATVATVLRRLGWLGALAGAARPPACAGAGTARQVDRFLWPPDGTTFQALRPPPAALPWPAAQPLPALQLRLVDGEGRLLAEPPATGQAPAATLPGLPYRLPQAARLQVCEGPCDATPALLDVAVTVVQGGPLYTLPCEGHALSRTQCSLALDAAGAASAAGFGEARSPAEAGAGLAKELLR